MVSINLYRISEYEASKLIKAGETECWELIKNKPITDQCDRQLERLVVKHKATRRRFRVDHDPETGRECKYNAIPDHRCQLLGDHQ